MTEPSQYALSKQSIYYVGKASTRQDISLDTLSYKVDDTANASQVEFYKQFSPARHAVHGSKIKNGVLVTQSLLPAIFVFTDS